MKKILEAVRLNYERFGVEKTKLFCLLTTAQKNIDSYLTPVRTSKDFVIFGAVVSNRSDAISLLEYCDERFDIIIVDGEKKIISKEIINVERIARENILKSKLHVTKMNDLTIRSLQNLLHRVVPNNTRGLANYRFGIIGMGNIGFKAALTLVELGCSVDLYSRDMDKSINFAESINLIKPAATIAEARASKSINDIFMKNNIIISCTSERFSVDCPDVPDLKGKIILDVGKQNLAPTFLSRLAKKNTVLRLSISNEICNLANEAMMYAGLIKTEPIGRNKIEGKWYVSGGVIGKLNDIVVDDCFSPDTIFGVADGKGGFINAASWHHNRSKD